MRLVLLGLVLIVLALGAPPQGRAQSLDAKAKGKKILLHLDVQMTNAQKKRLNGFKNRASFYGALALNPDDLRDEAFGASWGRHSLKAAQDMALRSCEYKSGTQGRCVLLASIVPGNRPPAPEGWGLSHNATKIYRDWSRWLDRNKHGVAVFATNMYSAWAWAQSDVSQAEAEAKALSICREEAAATGRGNSAAWISASVDAEANTCRVRQVVPANR